MVNYKWVITAKLNYQTLSKQYIGDTKQQTESIPLTFTEALET
jgi:hypothetical protein